ncbi:S8 family peptidase [Marinobacter sp. JSM 1782161]|uniref:S8 family peptidase n=1 Tax=Marinobacter sp. JSM 1782161 TaxID=2685906 RepID=UPI001401C822|nr:S8 family peptidase [Marinobacter sp. JSM 1782161]
MLEGSEKPRLGALLIALTLAGCGGGGGGSDDDDRVSGVIEIESRTRIDADTADDFFNGSAVRNDTDAQSLPSPVILAGYLSVGSGIYSGRPTDYFQDQRDRYQLTLADDQILTIRAFAVNGASAAGTPTAEVALDGRQIDTLTPAAALTLAPDAGEGLYELDLRAMTGGPMRYVVYVSAMGSGTTVTLEQSEPDWVPGEAIVTMASPADVQALSTSVDAMGSGQRRELARGIWHFRQGETSALHSLSTTGQRKGQTLDWIRELRETPGVLAAEPNYRYRAQVVNALNDPLYPSQQWHYQAINLPTAWQALGNPGLGARVAVLDTGLFSETPAVGGNWHPDLDNGSGQNVEVLAQSDFVSDDDDNESGPDGNPATPGNDDGPSFHGTHVAGTIAALDNNLGGVGVAPQATLLPIRVLDSSGAGTSQDLINAISYLANLPAAQRPDVINLSLAGLGPSSALESVINTASNRGILVVAAAGNQGTSEPVYPAAFDRVLAVGAVDGGNRRASYSSFGSWLDLVAPGGDVTRDGNSDGQPDAIYSALGSQSGTRFQPAYAGLTGTSMAAPHVAGVLALMRSVDGNLTLDAVREYLRRGELTDSLGNATEYGAGLINALKAVDAASNGNLGTFLSAYPSGFQFDGSVTEARVMLSQVPADSTVDSIKVDNPQQEWLSISDNPVAGGVELVAQVTDIDAAVQASVTVNYNSDTGAQSLVLPVNVQLGDPEASRDAGRHYILLDDANDDSVGFQVAVQPVNGRYTFSFADVPDGEYLLRAGTDMDNNGVICEPGEACAEYPTVGLPQVIVKQGSSVSGLTMTTSFQRPVLGASDLPRTGFDGYSLNRKTDVSQATDAATKEVAQ